MSQPSLLTLSAALLLAGCGSLAPTYERPAAPVPTQLPLAAAEAASASAAPAAPLAWQDFVRHPAPRRLVELALANNRDLRVAALNVERARAQLDVSLADRYPTIGVGVAANSAPNTQSGNQAQSYTAGLQMASWELDFLGRIGNLNDAARSQLLATEAGRRSAELALVGAVLSSYLNLVADAQLLGVAERTLASREATFKLTRIKSDAGAASKLEEQSAVTLLAQARVARQQALRQRSQDLATLALLLGGPVPDDAVPQPPVLDPAGDTSAPAPDDAGADAAWAALLAEVPVGLSSEVLLRRPDVVQAEQQLQAANANIGAARAAMFPRITLTASAGQASSQFSGLFQGGNFAWTLGAQALMTLFDAGRNQANVNASKVGRDIAVAQYERAVQAAFKDTADALNGLATWRDQRQAQADQLASAREIARLTELRYGAGAASELERLDAQRSLYAAEQALVQTRLAEQQNRVGLWKALGG
ncbi:RND efflux system, outer membrane lipoprotein, NodT family [Leptothrix cholodnii SP-6]|uniref:RND efflux system, outer membrane lipoprotein, NodT family n=1 Tax=Leptothrix cholodnii (strain ATCC 51168 / LMG 8142 / SP-6) TaxID=395495 RepID=B1Y5S0_LEPCP|nr:efflux transporter outer membrane subunit [Leptothrix cholodnii]ACB35966.1 RND efflux system, outer membrane lipoprotein, NodT family [Leptothrix cholodnii SP-6]